MVDEVSVVEADQGRDLFRREVFRQGKVRFQSVGKGKLPHTLVPPVDPGCMEHLPPTSAARSRIESSPIPACCPTAIPTPSSVTSTQRLPSTMLSRTKQIVACAWRTTLVKASCTIR